ncbi:MAG: hypothetical protein ACRD5J_16900 [Nitrososphaeraceae archaeon]
MKEIGSGDMNIVVVLAAMLCFGELVMVVPTNPRAYASGPEWDCDEDFIDIPGACNCWHSGYMNGTIGFSAFNVTENEECKDKGDQYQAGFDAASKK